MGRRNPFSIIELYFIITSPHQHITTSSHYPKKWPSFSE